MAPGAGAIERRAKPLPRLHDRVLTEEAIGEKVVTPRDGIEERERRIQSPPWGQPQEPCAIEIVRPASETRATPDDMKSVGGALRA